MNRCRKDYRELTPQERDRFVQGLYYVKSTGVIDAYADEHDVRFGPIHGGSNFGPWHREFSRRFEDELKAYDSRITVPYWNWMDDRSTTSMLWSDEFLGQFDSAWSLGRVLGSSTLPTADQVEIGMGITPFLDFTTYLESTLHNAPHQWVAGTMVSVRSPADPVFYLHHNFIDLLWAQWQIRNPTMPFVSSGGTEGVAIDAPMPGFTTTPGDVEDHTTINKYKMPAGFVPDAIDLELTNPSVTFNDIPEGITSYRAAVVELDSCEMVSFTVSGLTVDSGPGSFEVVHPITIGNPDVDPYARVWFSHAGTSDGDITLGHCTVDCVETGESLPVMLSANTVERESAAVVMLLDQSNSMHADSGITDNTRADVLTFSAPPFVDVIGDESAVGVVSFDHDLHPGIGITDIGGGGRIPVNSAISGYSPNPNGWTSIGEAVAHAHDLLDSITDHPIKAMIVLTDGKESHGDHDRRYISEVSDFINNRVFAIGLGTAEALEPNSLSALCNGTSGYMLMTGELNDDTYFRLAKYYQQILAGVTNTSMVLDPEGWIRPGQEIKIPFSLSTADVLAKTVLLTPAPFAIDFTLITPDGEIIHSGIAAANPGVTFRAGDQVALYEFSLPLPTASSSAHAGQWHVLLRVDKDRYQKYLNSLDNYPKLLQQALAHGIRYNVTVQTYSGIRLTARVKQSGMQPGDRITITSRLDQGGMPLDASSSMLVDIERPDSVSQTLTMVRQQTGHYASTITADLSGIYHIRVHVDGREVRGEHFTREQVLTAAVWSGGNNPPPSNDGGGAHDRDKLCELLMCFMRQKKFLDKAGIDIEELTRCLKKFCEKRSPTRRSDIDILRLRVDEIVGNRELTERLLRELDQQEN